MQLWTVLPTELRTDLAAARSGYAAMARLAGWATLYAVLVVVWWPAALIGGTVLITAGWQTPDTADVLADLVETALDLHVSTLASQLGLAARDAGQSRATTARPAAVAGLPGGPAVARA